MLYEVITLPVGGLVLSRVWIGARKWWLAWAASAATIVGCTFFGIIGLFPALLPSSIDPAFSLTTMNAASTPLTLKIMLTVACIFVPIVLVYQIWTYKTFATRLTKRNNFV